MLTSITIPDSVTSIGWGAFACWPNIQEMQLTEIIVSDGNANYCSINGVLYNKEKTEIVCYPAGKAGETYVILDGVTSIGSYAFSGCWSLKSITIPDSVTSIGDCAFTYCYALTSITIPSGVTKINIATFQDCMGLTSITIPDSVTSIDVYAFWGCTGLTSVTFKNTSGWFYADPSTATSGTSISSDDLEDSATAATYLTSTYYNYYWKRS